MANHFYSTPSLDVCMVLKPVRNARLLGPAPSAPRIRDTLNLVDHSAQVTLWLKMGFAPKLRKVEGKKEHRSVNWRYRNFCHLPINLFINHMASWDSSHLCCSLLIRHPVLKGKSMVLHHLSWRQWCHKILDWLKGKSTRFSIQLDIPNVHVRQRKASANLVCFFQWVSLKIGYPRFPWINFFFYFKMEIWRVCKVCILHFQTPNQCIAPLPFRSMWAISTRITIPVEWPWLRCERSECHVPYVPRRVAVTNRDKKMFRWKACSGIYIMRVNHGKPVNEKAINLACDIDIDIYQEGFSKNMIPYEEVDGGSVSYITWLLWDSHAASCGVLMSIDGSNMSHSNMLIHIYGIERRDRFPSENGYLPVHPQHGHWIVFRHRWLATAVLMLPSWLTATMSITRFKSNPDFPGLFIIIFDHQAQLNVAVTFASMFVSHYTKKVDRLI